MAHTFDLEVLSIGRGADEPEGSCTLEVAGGHLFYAVTVGGGSVSVSAQVLDRGGLEYLVRLADNADGWRTVCQLIAGLERGGVRSLQRPIRIGEPGNPDSWVIA